MQIDEVELYKSNLIYFISKIYGKTNETLKISASSTHPDLGTINKSTIDTILDLNGGRWVSDYEINPYFIIEFQQGKFYMQSYVFKWAAYTRYNTNWMVEGFTKSSWEIIDSQNRSDLCSDKSQGLCLHDIEQLFIIKNPCYISKLRFTAIGPDTLNQNTFSLTQLMLFGQYHFNHTNARLNMQLKLIPAFTLIVIVNIN